MVLHTSSSAIAYRAGRDTPRTTAALDIAAARTDCHSSSTTCLQSTAMPRVRGIAQEGICEIVLPGDEPPCTQPGQRRHDGNRPHLCAPHHKEYGRLTKEYKETSSKAQLLYDRVRALLRDLHLGQLCELADVDEALETTSRCIEILSTEIRQRQDHQKRFFVQSRLSRTLSVHINE